MIPLDLGASCAYFPLEIWPGRGLPVRSFPSFLPRCWFGGHEIDQVGVMIQWVMSNPRFFLRQLFGKMYQRVSGAILRESCLFHLLVWVLPVARVTKPATLGAAKSGELSDEFHAFLEFLYLRQLRPHCFICFLNLSECPDVRWPVKSEWSSGGT